MTARTYARYNSHQILALCAVVLLDDLRCRLMDGKALSAFTRIARTRQAHPHNMLLEWPDGVLVCLISSAPFIFENLPDAEKLAAYRAGFAGEVVYRIAPAEQLEPLGVA